MSRVFIMLSEINLGAIYFSNYLETLASEIYDLTCLAIVNKNRNRKVLNKKTFSILCNLQIASIKRQLKINKL